MNLDDLKPAWNKFKLLNSMQTFEHADILLMLDNGGDIPVNKTYRVVLSAIMFIILTICCQGG